MDGLINSGKSAGTGNHYNSFHFYFGFGATSGSESDIIF
jgi:hypothetical protein